MSRKKKYLVEDMLDPDLKLVFCGTAAGKKSAAEKAYYAHGGNRFWPTLRDVKLTPRQFTPKQYRELLKLGIGLTDLCKTASGNDADLKAHQFNPKALRQKIHQFQPKILAFTSKNAAEIFLGRKVTTLGLQPEAIGKTRLFVLTSTSGQNAHWKAQRHSWQDLAKLLKKGA